MTIKKHLSVLANEFINKCEIKSEGGIYVDATLGFGGHTSLVKKKYPNCKIVGIEQDVEALVEAKRRLKAYKEIVYVNDNFVNLDKILTSLKIDKVDVIFFDLGTNYYQLSSEERGFSYHHKSKLDMRMNQKNKLDATYVINTYSKNDLERVFREYGEEKQSKALAKAIVNARKQEAITTSEELNDIKGFNPKKHPAKNIYQAIRIEVNNELEVLKESLEKALELIKVGGLVMVITFHSLEDKIVKETFWNVKQEQRQDIFKTQNKFNTFKTIYPKPEELIENNSARSAKLRIIKKNYE